MDISKIIAENTKNIDSRQVVNISFIVSFCFFNSDILFADLLYYKNRAEFLEYLNKRFNIKISIYLADKKINKAYNDVLNVLKAKYYNYDIRRF